MKEDPLLFYHDVVKIFRKRWRFALCGGAVLFVLYLNQETNTPILYKSVASFKAVEREAEPSPFISFKTLFSSSGSAGNKIKTVMLSRDMLKKLIVSTGMQIEQHPPIFSKFEALKRKILLNLNRPFPIPHEFVFSNVEYKGNLPLSFSLQRISSENFLYKRGEVEIKGAFFVPFKTDEIAFTLDEGAFQEAYFQVAPIDPCIDALIEEIEVYPNPEDSSVFELEYLATTPLKGTRLLDKLIAFYQQYLIDDYERMVSKQLAHLDHRFLDLGNKGEEALNQFADFLSKHEILSVETTGKELTEKLKFIEKEIKEDQDKEHFLIHSDFTVNGMAAPSLAKLTSQLNNLLSRRMTIDINSLEDETESILGKIFANLKLFQSPPSVLSQKEALMIQIEKTKGFINLGSMEEKKYIQDLIGISAEILLERRIYQHQSRDYSGLDLDHVYSLYQKRCNQRDDYIFKVKNIQKIVEQFTFANFEKMILSGALTGYIAEDFLKKACEVFQLRSDSINRTEKELHRLEIAYQETYENLLNHLKEVAGRWLHELECAKNYMKELNNTVLDLLNKQILLTKNQIYSQKKALLEEIGERIERNQEIKKALLLQRKFLPHLFIEEKKLQMKSEMTNSMLQGLSQMIESKLITKTLSTIESRALNAPYCNLEPLKSQMLLKGIGLGACGFFGIIISYIGMQIFAGFPVTLEKLKYQGYRVAGYFKDREVLRKITQGASGVVAFLGQDGPDYSHEAAKLLSLEGKKVLLIEAHFNSLIKAGAGRGLLSYLEEGGEEPLFISQEGYDYLPMLGRSSFGVELFRSKKFKNLIQSYKEKYEVILLYSSAKIESREAESLLEVCERACITLQGEKEEDLKPYQDWNKGKERLLFAAYL